MPPPPEPWPSWLVFLSWIALRPICSLAAVALAIATAAPGWAKMLAVLLILVARPIRRPLWIVVPVGVLVLLGLDGSAVAVVARTVVGEVSLVSAGAGRGIRERRQAGLLVVTEARRRALGLDGNPARCGDDAGVNDSRSDAVLAGSGDLMGSVAYGWTTIDSVQWATETRTGVRRAWKTWRSNAADRLVWKGLALGASRELGLRLALAVAVGVVAAVIPPGDRGFWVGVVAVGTAFLLMGRAGRALAIVGLVYLFAAGGLVVVIVVTGASLLSRLALQVHAAVPRALRNRPRGLTRRDLGRDWSAWKAALVAGERDPGLGVEMLSKLGHRTSDSGIRSACLAQVARLELGRGRYDQALRSAHEAQAILTGGSVPMRRPAVWAVASAGSVLWELGQDLGPVMAVASEVPLEISEAAEVLSLSAEEFVAMDRAEEALDLLESATIEAADRTDFAAAASLEVAIASVHNAAGEFDEAAGRLEHLGWDEVLQLAGTTERVEISGRRALLVGQIALSSGRAQEALPLLQSATTRLVDAAYPLRSRAWILKGSALGELGDWPTAVDSIGKGLGYIETPRQQLPSGEARAQAFVSESSLYRLALETLVDAAESGERSAGGVAVRLIESVHRSALAELLRSGPLDLPEDVRLVIEHLHSLEEIPALPPRDSGLSAAPLSPTDDQDLVDARSQLEAAVSAMFADAYIPREVDLSAIRAAAGNAHLLSYLFPDRGLVGSGYVAWYPPEGDPEVHRVELGGRADGRELLAYVARSGPMDRPPASLERPWQGSGDLLNWLGDQLIPEGLRRELQDAGDDRPAPLVISAGQELARFPFAALRIGEHFLLDLAVLQTTSSFDQLGPAVRRRSTVARVLYHASLEETDARTGGPTRDAPTGARYVGARDLAEIAARLTSHECDGALFAVHGSGFGLDQRLELASDEVLSASKALQYRWPRWVLLAACFVGGVEHQPGAEPLGLPVACLLGGCESVIGGVLPVDSADAQILADHVIEQVARGIDPAVALRVAQRELSHRELLSWAPFCCISPVVASGRRPVE
ncbi:MAG: CHAT domain-containing protein [bacterium]|nr:CHAT domain-containing protein [bacterium]